MTRTRRIGATLAAAAIATAVVLPLVTGPALACGGLVAPNGSVRLLRTSTLAAYHDGVEHYVTSFTFAGGGGGDTTAPPSGPSEFGSIVPLPAIPTKVERGGDWTLQRLAREVAPPVFAAAGASVKKATVASDSARVVLQTRIDALDLTVLEGGGKAVGDWAREHGFLLTPDAPEMLDYYAARSPVFLAARFDATAARSRGLQAGDGTPIHLTIPVDNPWVPLRILSLGRGALEPINADVFVLTDSKPALLPVPAAGLQLERSEPASQTLMRDLRSDKGMDWMPDQMWLSYLRIDATGSQLHHDLAIDATGNGHPSVRLAGIDLTGTDRPPAQAPGSGFPIWVVLAAVVAVGAVGLLAGVATAQLAPARSRR
jgi:hypothetical protein